ncbi:protein Spindly-A-like [Hydractinia symbiolongicarpus]|uniref:protein Spindly-A-like n=1 Tax=Hydractinia symbiolongicarpus TaxID=13093 RepID=UPI00254A14B2|nr:protein Spindly-A-like [Hydractinia symbiolongicarpus]
MENSFCCDEDEISKQRYNSSVESLEELDWDGLLELCKEKEEKLNLAGTYGLKLHEQLIETQSHIDEMRAQHEAEIEKLVQETFELRNKLELKEKSIHSQQQEFEAYQKQVSKRNETDEEELRNQFKKDFNLLKKEKDTVLNDLDQAQLRERHANTKIIQLEEKIHELQADNQKKVQHVTTEDSNSEVFQLHEKIFLLEEECEQNNAKIQELQNENQTLSLDLRAKISELSSISKELEEAEKRSTSYFNHLQQAREESTEVRVELDALKAELRGLGHSKTGNSLFGELEDKRVEMEKKLLSMQVKHVSLQKAYSFVKSQLHNMKTQVVALLQMNSGRADGERIVHLERALSQAKEEALALSKKIKSQEASQDLSAEGIQALARSLPQFECNQDMINFLSIQLEDYKAKLRKTEEELEQTYMMKLAESDKLQTAEQKLHETGVSSEKFKSENMKLRLRLDEIKNKLQAETQKRILVEKKFNYDSTDDVVAIGVAEPPTKERKSLPYTLAKAKEKENEKFAKTCSRTNNAKKPASFSSGMNWNVLPKEILKEFNIQRRDNFEPSRDRIDNVFKSPAVSASTQQPSKENRTPIDRHNTKGRPTPETSKSRKVSFKEEPETIVVSCPNASVIDESAENFGLPETNQETKEKISSELSNTPSPEPLQSSSVGNINRNIKIDNEANKIFNIPKATNDDNPECKMQ